MATIAKVDITSSPYVQIASGGVNARVRVRLRSGAAIRIAVGNAAPADNTLDYWTLKQDGELGMTDLAAGDKVYARTDVAGEDAVAEVGQG